MNINSLVLCILIGISVSCVDKKPPKVIIPIDKTPAVSVIKVGENVTQGKLLSIAAKNKVISAQAEVERARQEVRSAKALVAEMKSTNSQYAVRVEEFRKKLCVAVETIAKWLKDTGDVLDSQMISLRRAELELEKAKNASIASEKEKRDLRLATNHLQVALVNEKKRADENEQYKDKYHKLTKYKWIVWGLGAWILIKFIGGLGAWSPQGKIAKALIG